MRGPRFAPWYGRFRGFRGLFLLGLLLLSVGGPAGPAHGHASQGEPDAHQASDAHHAPDSHHASDSHDAHDEHGPDAQDHQDHQDSQDSQDAPCPRGPCAPGSTGCLMMAGVARGIALTRAPPSLSGTGEVAPSPPTDTRGEGPFRPPRAPGPQFNLPGTPGGP